MRPAARGRMCLACFLAVFVILHYIMLEVNNNCHFLLCPSCLHLIELQCNFKISCIWYDFPFVNLITLNNYTQYGIIILQQYYMNIIIVNVIVTIYIASSLCFKKVVDLLQVEARPWPVAAHYRGWLKLKNKQLNIKI